jgi:hypothetical protein
MAIETGKRYCSPAGVEFVVTKGGRGLLTDGDIALVLKDDAQLSVENLSPADMPHLPLGTRNHSQDGTVEVLVVKPGLCDLRHDGRPMRRIGGDDGGAGAGVPRRSPPGDFSTGAAGDPDGCAS